MSLFEFLKKIFSLFKTNKGRKKKAFLPPEIKTKSDEKYKRLLSKFKRENKRTPKRDEKFKLVVTASHHVYPVKGKNSRKWMRGEKGHWKRQKVRKYLLHKYKINLNFKMIPPKNKK
tara:strand:- start:1254 stop:1604 length:351 start_codon:yes stop_codon:yes gene_type:complete